MRFNITTKIWVLSSVVGLAFSSILYAQVSNQHEPDIRTNEIADSTIDDHREFLPASPNQATEAAKVGLRDVLQLAPSVSKSAQTKLEDDIYARALGFASAQEAGRAQLGRPFSIYMLNLRSLKDYAEKSRAEDLPDFSESFRQMIYPLLVDDKVKSSLTVAEDHKTKQWETTSWGSPKLIQLMEESRQPKSNIAFFISPQNPYGLRFIGENRDGKLFLSPMADIPKLNLKAGQQMSAHNLFILLKPLAKEYSESK